MTQDVLDILRDVKDCTTLKLGSYAYDCKSCEGYDSVCMEGPFNGGHVPVIMAVFQGDTIVRAEEGSGDLAVPFGWVEMITMARDAYLGMKGNVEQEEDVHLLLIQYEDELETCFRLFHSKQDVKEYLAQDIRKEYDSRYGDDMSDADREEMESEIADMEKGMDEQGYWDDYDGTRFTYKCGEYEDMEDEDDGAEK